MGCMKDYLIWCEEKLAAKNPHLPWSVVERLCTEGIDFQKIPGYTIQDYLKNTGEPK